MPNSIIKKYRGLSPAVKASIWFMICSILQKGISFFVVPVYTRMLSTSEYGIYSVYLSWVSIVYIFATLNIHAGVFNNGMVKYEERRDYFTSSVQGLSSLICIFVGIILLIFHQVVERYAEFDIPIICLMMLQIFFSASFNYWIARQRFDFKYRSIIVVTLIIAIASPLLAISLMKSMSNRSFGVILGTVVIQSLVGLALYIINWVKGKKFFDKQIWEYCLLFNVPLIPHYLSYVILGQADRIMIKSICGDSDAGIYSLAYQLSLVINLITNAIDGSFNPWTYQKLKRKEHNRIRSVSTYLILLFAVGVVGLSLIAPEILLIIAPSEYQSAKWVIPPVVAGCFFLFIAGSFMRVEFYHERNKIIMIASSTTAIINIVLNALFIPKYGFIAAAYTTLISYMLFALFHFVVMKDTCKKNNYEIIPFDGKAIFFIAFITTVLSIIFMSLYQLVIIRYALFVIIMLILIICKDKLIYLAKEIRNK